MRTMFTSENFQNCNFYDILVVLIIYVRTISDMYACTRTDVDECASWGNGCPQKCQNVKGSFKCQCHKGFFDTDNKGLECKAASEFSFHQSQLFLAISNFPHPHLLLAPHTTCTLGWACKKQPFSVPPFCHWYDLHGCLGIKKNSHLCSFFFAADTTCMVGWVLKKQPSSPWYYLHGWLGLASELSIYPSSSMTWMNSICPYSACLSLVSFFKATDTIKDKLFVCHLVYSWIMLSLKYKITKKGDVCVYMYSSQLQKHYINLKASGDMRDLKKRKGKKRKKCDTNWLHSRPQRDRPFHNGAWGPAVPLLAQGLLRRGCGWSASRRPRRWPGATAGVLDRHRHAPHQSCRGAQRQRRLHHSSDPAHCADQPTGGPVHRLGGTVSGPVVILILRDGGQLVELSGLVLCWCRCYLLPPCGKGFFSGSQLSVQAALWWLDSTSV